MTLADVRVAFAKESDLQWTDIKDTPGFGGVDIPGIQLKFFGKPGVGPWFYLTRHEPGVRVERHRHEGDVFHYILEGEWQIGANRFAPGFMQYEQKGLYYGPIVSGPQGSLFLAIYDGEPNFIEAPAEEKKVDPGAAYAAARGVAS
jgi:hypothetical protein